MKGSIQCRIYLVCGKQPSSSRAGPLSRSLWASSRRRNTWYLVCLQTLFLSLWVEWCHVSATQTGVLRPHSLDFYIRICILTWFSGILVLWGRMAHETCSLLHFVNIWLGEAVLGIASSVQAPSESLLTGLCECTSKEALTAQCDIWNRSLPMGGERQKSPWMSGSLPGSVCTGRQSACLLVAMITNYQVPHSLGSLEKAKWSLTSVTV